MILAKLENDFYVVSWEQRNWQMLFNKILKGGTAESSLIPWKRQEHRPHLPHMLGPSLESQGQLDGWTCSHGDRMSHLHLGLGMEKTLLSLALLPPVIPRVFHPSATPCQSQRWQESPFSIQTERWHRNKSFTFQITKNTDQRILYLLTIRFTWSFSDRGGWPSGDGNPSHFQTR